MQKVIPISEVCEAQQFTAETTVTITTGQKVHAGLGNWLVRNPVGHVGVMSDQLFRKTYLVVSEIPRPAAWEEPETA